ncbi:tetratricopeptide repeat protein [Streptomyces sp. NPDC087422]|uniref:AfsR/SARP family transcriptional regulator n=1 Tax=Streptomyces sp. NPDC087422 TaxID=3365786 RepID=UPI0037FC8141
MDFDIVVLGPMELCVEQQQEMRGAAKELQLLAALAVDAGKAISLDNLARRLWGDSPPAKPRASLHSYATRIRRKLGAEQLQQQAHTYALHVPPHTVDYHRFLRLITQARSLASSGDDAEALTLLRNADAMWRGVPLTGFSSLWAEQVRRRLTEHRLSATLLRTAIELRLGHFGSLVVELSGLAEQYPTDETVAQHFMAAAYGSGRQTDALRAFESLRRRLRQVGTQPGEALYRAYRSILDQAPVSELIPDGGPPGSSAPAPHNLPAHSRLLLGRTEEIRALQTAGAGVIAFQAISGMAGVGKTLLALHTAREVAHQYPDGVAYINLRAHAGQHPLSPEAALIALLRDFGIPHKTMPNDLAALITLWRTVLGNRRAVVVLDDAADAAQIQPLLPGDSPSLVLITSRRRVTGIPGVHHVFVDVLSPADAEALFTTLAGITPAEAPTDVAELVRLCGYLPLALELAAGRLRSRPTWTVGRLVRKMSQGPGRLAEIRDGQSELATVFAFSYHSLTAEEQRVFRLLSLHFTRAFDPYATAVLVGLPLDTTERILESLLDAHLLQEPAADRYEFHDLIGAYAQSLALNDPLTMRDEALDSLALFYARAVAAADLLLHPRRARLADGAPSCSFDLPDWPDARQAKKWLLAETDAVVGAASYLREHRLDEPAAQLADAASGFLETEGLWREAETVHTHAARHWRSTGNQSSEAHALLALATVHAQTGRYEMAERDSQRALDAARAVSEANIEAEALSALWLVCWNLGRLADSCAFQQESLDIRVRSGDEWNIARSRNNLGISLLQLGQHAEAMECFSAALNGFIRTRDPRGEAQALNNLGDLHHHMGQDDQARQAFDRVLALTTEFGSRTEQAIAQLNLGNTLDAPEDLAKALSLHRQALAAFRHVGDRRNETVALIAIGSDLYAGGHYAEAAAHHSVALTLARDIGAAQEEVQALRGLGMAEHRSDHRDSAVDRLTEALAMARQISSSEEEARAHAAIADVHFEAGRRNEALQQLHSAHAIFQGLNELEAARTQDRIRLCGEVGTSDGQRP